MHEERGRVWGGKNMRGIGKRGKIEKKEKKKLEIGGVKRNENRKKRKGEIAERNEEASCCCEKRKVQTETRVK